MAKKMKKLVATMLVLCMMVSMFGMTAFAAEDGTVVETETMTDGGLTTNVTTTTTTTTDATNNNVTVTVTIEKETTGTDSEGKTVTGQEVFTSTEVTDSNGENISYNWEENGSEKKEWTEEDNGDEAGQPEVTVKLEPGQTTSGSATTTETTGDINSSEGQTTTTTTERVVEATTSESEIVVESTGSGDFNPIQTDRDMIYVEENQLHTHSNTSYKQTSNPTSAMNNKPEDEQYDFLFIGQGQMSDFYVGTEHAVTGKEAHSGALQFELLYDPTVENGQYVKNEKDLFTAYCVDLTTGAVAGYWYKMDNLEDAGYYDEEAAAHIRSVVSTGYWGTNPGEDANAPATGSLEKLKQTMKAAGNSGLTDEEIDQLTPGQALAATQAAIWSYANETTDGAIVDEERLIITGYKAPTVPTDDDFKKAEAVYNFLRNLAPTEKSESTEIIDKESFIEEDSMSITVGDKVADEAANADDNQDNDVYNVAVNFALVVTPTDDDNLVVQVIRFGENGETIVAAQGRLAGDGSNDEGFNEVVYDEATGTFSLKNIKLAENADFNFDLKLVGTQHLEQGVYIFNSEVRNGKPSQTFVGLAEGNKEVNVKQSFVINFNVDEDNQVVSERVWHDEDDPAVAPAAGVFAVPARPLNNIPDEEVPLADAPQTGDEAIAFAVLTVLAGFGLAAMHVSEQKRKAEEA